MLKPLKQIEEAEAGEQIFANNFIDTYYPQRSSALEDFSLFNIFINFEVVKPGAKLLKLY